MIVEGDDHLISYAISKTVSGIAVKPRRSPRSAMIAGLLLLLLAILGGTAAWLVDHGSTPSSRPIHPAHRLAPPSAALEPETSPAPVQTAPDSDHLLPILQVVVWPAVALTGICGLFLLLWHAITGNRNVELEWKVTENVSGRVVISRVQAS